MLLAFAAAPALKRVYLGSAPLKNVKLLGIVIRLLYIPLKSRI